ncbi:response regulator transcription factor [Bacteroidota bacterium]
MNIVITFVNLFALFLGIITIGIALRLSKNYRHSFLIYYLYFLVCSVISGFFDWISFNWIWFLGSNFTSVEVELVYHVFWDLLGFPSALFAAFFLYITLSTLTDHPINQITKKIILAIIFFLIALSYISISLRMLDVYNPLGTPLWIVFLFFLPIVQLTILFRGFSQISNLKSNHRNYARKFILILFSGYTVWYILMLSTHSIGIWRHLIIVVFYLALLLPSIFLLKYFNSQMNKTSLTAYSKEKINNFLRGYEFTNREIDVITLILDGKSNQQIADELFISLQTVKNYLSRIYKKLNLKSRLELVNYINNYDKD